jgi:hypothetical protein
MERMMKAQEVILKAADGSESKLGLLPIQQS